MGVIPYRRYSPQALSRLSEILRPTVKVWMGENFKAKIFVFYKAMDFLHGFSFLWNWI
jgi:hypothetical protein